MASRDLSPSGGVKSSGEGSGFTPGPWTVGRMQRSSNFAKDTYCVHGDGTILCRVKGGVTEDAATAEANARLIAAAPDMLDALRAILAEAEEAANGPADPWIVGIQRHARAAIAKAEGA